MMGPDERKPLLAKGDRALEEELVEEHGRSSNGLINSYGQVTVDPDVEVENVIGDGHQQSYHRRWYILFLFSLLCFLQNTVWNTWSPLTQSVSLALGWTTADVALQANWGCITYLISAPFFSWLMDVKGLRVSCVLTSSLIAAGSALRCITMEPKAATWLINAGQMLNGFAGPVLMAGPPLLSAIWFPAFQRTTATSLTVLSMALGIAASFVVGPLMVPNVASSNSSSDIYGNETRQDVLMTRYNILRLMYVECLCCVAAFVALLIYFPDRPPMAPSRSASTKRIDFKAGMRQLIRHVNFWKVSVTFSVAIGIGAIWASMLTLFVTDLISELEAGWLGFIGQVVGGTAGCVVSRFTDVYARRFKRILIALFLFALVMVIIFTLECMKVIPFNRGILYSTFIAVMIGISGASPLFYELACETAFPIAEGLTNGVQTWMNNVVGLIFLLMFMIPAIGNSKDMQWMNWTMIGGIVVCLPILFVYKESYNRLDLDTINVVKDEDEESQTTTKTTQEENDDGEMRPPAAAAANGHHRVAMDTSPLLS